MEIEESNLYELDEVKPVVIPDDDEDDLMFDSTIVPSCIHHCFILQLLKTNNACLDSVHWIFVYKQARNVVTDLIVSARSCTLGIGLLHHRVYTRTQSAVEFFRFFAAQV